MSGEPGSPLFDLACEHSKSSGVAGRIRILVVDDTPEVLQTITALLEREAGLEVAGTADDGFAAIDAVEKLTPDLVLLDVNMPGMNGFATAMRLRTYYPALKIVMASADDDPEMPRVCREAGADAFLWKVDLPRELGPRIRDLFRPAVAPGTKPRPRTGALVVP